MFHSYFNTGFLKSWNTKLTQRLKEDLIKLPEPTLWLIAICNFSSAGIQYLLLTPKSTREAQSVCVYEFKVYKSMYGHSDEYMRNMNTFVFVRKYVWLWATLTVCMSACENMLVQAWLYKCGGKCVCVRIYELESENVIVWVWVCVFYYESLCVYVGRGICVIVPVSPVSRYGWQLLGRVGALSHPSQPSKRSFQSWLSKPPPYFSCIKLFLLNSLVNTVPWDRP